MATSYTPKHLRRRGAKRNGTVGPEKKMQFRKTKAVSDRWIHQPASTLEGNKDYQEWCAKADRGALRAGKGG